MKARGSRRGNLCPRCKVAKRTENGAYCIQCYRDYYLARSIERTPDFAEPEFSVDADAHELAGFLGYKPLT